MINTWHKATLPQIPSPKERWPRSVVSSWLQEVEVGRCCLQPLGAQGQGEDAWCGMFTADCSAHLAPCFFARDLKITMLAPDGHSSPIKEELPFFFFKGDFPCYTWCCVQKNFVALKNLLTLNGPFSSC